MNLEDTNNVSTPNVDIMDVFTIGEEQSVQGEELQNVTQDGSFGGGLSEKEIQRRTDQSRYDKLFSEHEKLAKEVEDLREYKIFLSDLSIDNELLESFVNEINPELVQKKDKTDFIKSKLREEFGDYKPTREEADEEPGGKAWLYFKKLNDLYETSKDIRPTKKVKEIKEERKALMENQLDKVKRDFGYSDDTLKNFYDWANGLDLSKLASIYNFATKTMRNPNLISVSGKQNQPQTNRDKFLTTF